MLTLDGFVDDCLAALREDGRAAVLEVLRDAIGRPTELERVLGPVTEGGDTPLYVSADLTVAHLVWAPRMTMYPHDHRMWAAIGVYRGAELNRVYRRSECGLSISESWELRSGQVALLEEDAIHAVVNPTDDFSAALHVFGGDFVHQPRSEWDWETLSERPYDEEHTRRLFEAANTMAEVR